ncbi:MAG: ATP-binding cassette domain-containing protein [Eubacteriales bacterium]|nr:ATP-binding cassette domain-containing protein [Eubacteriales bacterium]MDD3199185.1 ATP-binding cassette domain-containing protein [Eubacteriales bacterium]MDD4122373.1 ATP-binding cassette domain-containing protein [Eubacteriales bacterium]MDD4629160.1 ATP-binding cassette domain-containing protein [Eubacteriales bacterium]
MKLYMENLTKEYEGRKVLDIGKLQIEKGDLCGIIGPNGAGKSTLLNLIAGLIKPTSGRLMYGDEMELTAPQKKITMVFQTPYLMHTTVEKNIAYPLKLRNWSSDRIEARVEELTRELGLTNFRRQKSWKLSGGETQKVALARALSFQPELLLLDEPTANVDPSTTAEIEKMLKRINDTSGTTVILVTHNLVQAKRVCAQAIFLNQGKVVEYGESEKMLKSPEHDLTRRFVAGELLI